MGRAAAQCLGASLRLSDRVISTSSAYSVVLARVLVCVDVGLTFSLQFKLDGISRACHDLNRSGLFSTPHVVLLMPGVGFCILTRFLHISYL